jgi:hypothetical protein
MGSVYSTVGLKLINTLSWKISKFLFAKSGGTYSNHYGLKQWFPKWAISPHGG